MKKLQVSLAAAAAVALFASGAQACEWHQQHVMASATPVAEQPATPAASATRAGIFPPPLAPPPQKTSEP